jgi:hypothetical protein
MILSVGRQQIFSSLIKKTPGLFNNPGDLEN